MKFNFKMNYNILFPNFDKNQKYNISKVNKIIEYIYSQNFCEILLKDKNNFINDIETQIIEMIKLKNKGNDLNYINDSNYYKKKRSLLISKYDTEYYLLKYEFNKYKDNPNQISYLTKYRKHCINTEKNALHKCSNNINGKFFEINIASLTNNKESKNYKKSYIICSECNYCYPGDYIKAYCSSCKCEYFTSKLDVKDDENIFPSTWSEYHCNQILVNEIMKCIKCENILYINILTKKLICLNKNCNFNTSPENIIWTCKFCKNNFHSSAKVYNPLEDKILQKEVWKGLILKQKAVPKKLMCCLKNDKDINIDEIKFYHNKFCKGEIYKGNINGNDIVICGKCHAVNLYDKFIWTCPKCNKKISNNSEEKYNENNIINKNNLKLNQENKSVIKSKELKKIGDEKKLVKNDNNHNTNFKQNKNSNIKKLFEPEKRIKLFKKESKINSLLSHSQDSNSSYLKNQTTSKKIYLNNYSKRFKKIKYKTLFDILEQREKYKLENQSIDDDNNNEFKVNETINQAKNKLNEKYEKRRLKLLGNSCSYRNISKKKDKKTIYKNYFCTPPKKQTNKLINNISGFKQVDSIDINNKENIIKKNLLNESMDFEEEISYNFYKDLIYSKRYKDEHSTTTNEDNEKIDLMKINDISPNKSHKKNIYTKKIYLNDELYNIKKKNQHHKKKTEINIFESIDNNKNIKIINSSKDKINENKNKTKKDNIEKNQIFKKIYLNKINLRQLKLLSSSREKNNNQKLQLSPSINKDKSYYINNRSYFNKSPSNLLIQNIKSKEDAFLTLTKDCKIPSFEESNFQNINILVKGAFNVIYLVEDKKTKKQYALKRLIYQDFSQISKYKKELELIYKLEHPNIIKIYNIFFKYIDNATYLSYILMEKAISNWETEIEKRYQSFDYYTENELINILNQLVNALLYLQKKNITHGNIKPQNILICENNTFKVADIGGVNKNKLFISPKPFFGNKFKVEHNSFKNDVFSLGYCLLYAMSLDIKLIKSIREINSMIEIKNIIDKYNLDKRYSDKFMNICYNMINNDVDKRYDFYELNEEINSLI